ncbi:MAG: lipid-binding SYLF domain-containing protein [Vicinamibacterales bacterium]
MFLRQSYAFTLAITIGVGVGLPALLHATRDSREERDRLSKSAEVVEALVATPDDAIPEYILDRAEGIVVIPTLVKGGLVVGAEHGRGVMSVRHRQTRTWSVPSFVSMTGGSIGWQIGLQSVDLVLLVMNADGIDDLLKSEFKLGANASVAAGPIGRTAQAATDATMSAKILAYSRAKGLFAGATVEGAALRDDRDANERFYGKAYSSAELFDERSPVRAAAGVASWRTVLERATRVGSSGR